MANNFTFEPPGFQNDFLPGEEQLAQQLRSRWNEDVNRLTERLLQNEPWNFTNQPTLTDYYNPRTTDVPKEAAVVPITWTAYPNRIKFYLPEAGQRKHWEYADNGVPNPLEDQKGPRGWQDEYAEWSVTRNGEGKITKVSFSSETREYWYALWDVAPNVVLRLYKQLVSEQVKLEDLYLRDTSGNPIIDPQTGRPAYNELNEWNNKSTGGLAHLVATFNFQYGAMFLGAQSTILRADEQGNAITDPSQLVIWGQHATPNRNSDPFISARVNDLVRSGVRVTLKNPIGIYLQEPNFGTYELPFDAPDGAKPSDYWKVIRGRKRQAGEAYDLILHAVYEVPAELGFTVSDISINGFPIEYGAQIAETLQVAVIGEGIPQQTAPRSYGRVESITSNPYPAVLREVDLLKVAERSNLNMRIEPGMTIANVALKARNSDRNATIEFVGAPGVTAQKTGFQEDSQIFTLTITAAADAPLGNRSLVLKNSDGSAGPARFGMLEVTSPGTIGGIGAQSCKTDGSGNISVFRKYVGWRKTWHSIVPGNFGGTNNTDRLFYDPTTGDGEFFKIDSSGNVSLLKKHTGWRKTWKLIIPGNFGGSSYTDLLFYDPSGEGEFYATDGSGNISLLKKHTGWNKTFELIIPGNFGASSYTDLLFYDPTTGEGNFYATDGNGNISLLKKYTGWRKTWHSIIPGNFGGNSYTDLLFYDPTTGEGEFYTTDGNGNISLLKRHTGWRKTWKLIIPGNFGGNGYTDLLFYDPTTGEGEFYTTDGNGNISLLKGYTGWRKTWNLIVPENSGSYTDLLFYDQLKSLGISELVGGNPVTHRGISDTRTNFYLVDTNNPLNADGEVNSWEIWAEKTLPVQLIIYRKEVYSWSVVGKSEVKTPVAGFNQFSLSAPIAVKKGDFVGMYNPQAGSVSFSKNDDRTPGDLGHLSGTVIFTGSGGNATAFSGSSNRTYSLAVKGSLKLSDEDEIRRLFEETYATNVRSGDVDAYVAMFTEDAFWMPPGDADRRGVNEIAEAFGMQSISVAIEPKLTAEEIQVNGNFAYIVGISLATITPKDGGQSNKVKLRIVWLLRKEAGTWKIAREIWNSKPMLEEGSASVKPKNRLKQEPKGSTVPGTDFEIIPNAQAPQSRIKGILINGGWAIDTIQVEYEDIASNSEKTYMSIVGGKGKGNPNKFSIERGDYLTKVIGTWGRQAPGYPKEEIISLQFETHKGVKSPIFGGGNPQKEVKSFVFEAQANHEIVGFLGAYGGHQNALVRFGVYCQAL